MKVGQLKEILELMKKINSDDSDYGIYLEESILDLSDEDVSTILKNKNNENIPILVTFLTWWQKKSNREEFYENLKFEEDDEYYKTIITEKLLHAENPKTAHAILAYFMDELSVNEVEWLMFLDCLYEDFENVDFINLRTMLLSFDGSKLELIKKAMSCFEDCEIDEQFCNKFIFLASDKEKMTLLDLYHGEEGYSYEYLFDLINKLRNESYGDKAIKIIEYLKKPIVYDCDLPNVFLNTSKDEVDEILEFLPKITNENILVYYTEYKEHYDNDRLLRIFTERLQTVYKLGKDGLVDAYSELYDEMKFFDSLLKKKQKPEENNSELEKILDCLDNLYEEDSESFENSPTIASKLLPYLEYKEWNEIIENSSLSSLTYIYENKNDFFNAGVVDGLKDLISKLKDFSVDELTKIHMITKLESFRKHEDKIEIFNLMLSENGMGSLDYIYQVYLEEEKKNYLVKEVDDRSKDANNLKLLTVFELLVADNDPEKVLDGFNDEDEVNSKTLIRTFAYKNNIK